MQGWGGRGRTSWKGQWWDSSDGTILRRTLGPCDGPGVAGEKGEEQNWWHVLLVAGCPEEGRNVAPVPTTVPAQPASAVMWGMREAQVVTRSRGRPQSSTIQGNRIHVTFVM